MLAWKPRDSTPNIKPAGKVFPRNGAVQECMVMPKERRTPDLVKRVRGDLRPEVGRTWDTSDRTGDPPMNPDISHGVTTVSSLKASHLVNPPLQTRFEEVGVALQEAIYESSKVKPLGQSHDQIPNLPRGLDLQRTRFGRKTPKGESLGEIVTPQKSAKQVEEEAKEGRDLYRKSHNDLDVGERVDRNYDWSKFTKESLYGLETPHSNSGLLVRTTMKWLQNDENGKVISKRLDDFREKTQPKTGEVHDPMADTLDVPPGYRFGITVPVDKYNAGTLVHSEGPTSYAECQSLDEGLLASVRNHLKKQKYLNFEDLYAAFHSKDKEESGVIPAETVHDIAFHFNVPLTFEMLDMLIRWTSREETGGVVYQDLIVLMDWTCPIPDDKLFQMAQLTANEVSEPQPISDPATPLSPMPPLSKMKLSTTYMTSSQAYRATVGELPTHGYKVHGVPTIRTDLPAPTIKKVADHKNYGDEAGSFGLMYPSIYSSHGVYEQDFFKPQPPEKIRQLFEQIGVTMPTEVFEDLWERAKEKSPKGQVCVETFRMVLEELNLAHAASPAKAHKATATT